MITESEAHLKDQMSSFTFVLNIPIQCSKIYLQILEKYKILVNYLLAYW